MDPYQEQRQWGMPWPANNNGQGRVSNNVSPMPMNIYAPIQQAGEPNPYWSGMQMQQADPNQMVAALPQPQETDSIRDRFMALKKDHSKLQKAKSKADKELEYFQTELATLEGLFATLNEQLPTLREENSDLKEKLTQLEGIRAVTGEVGDKAKTFIEELKIARDEAVEQRIKTGEKLRKLRVENADLRDNKRSIEDQLRFANQQNKLLQTQMNEGMGRIQSENRELQGANKVLEDQLREANLQLKKLSQETDRAIGDKAGILRGQGNAELREANLALKSELQEAKEKLREAESVLKNDLQESKLLQKQLEEERKTVERLRPMNKVLQDELAEFKADKSSSQHLAKTTEQQLKAAMDTIGALEAKLKVASALSKPKGTSRGLKEQSMEDTLLDELAKAKSAISNTQGEVQTVLDHNMLDLKVAHDAMHQKLQKTNKEIAALEAKMNQKKKALEAELKVAQEKVSDLTNGTKELRSKLAEAEKEREGLQENRNRTSEELRQQKDRGQKVEKDLSERLDAERKLQALVDKHKEEEKNLSSQLAESQKVKRDLEATVDSYQRLASQLETETGEIVARQHKLEGDLKMLQLERDNLKETADHRKTELSDSQDALKKSKSLAEKYGEKIKQLESDAARLTEDKGRLERDIEERGKRHVKDLTAQRTERDAIAAVLDEVRDEAKKLRTANEKERKKLATVEDEIKECRNENEELEKKQRKYAKEVTALKLAKEELEGDLEAQKARLRHKDLELEKSKEQIAQHGQRSVDLEAQVLKRNSQTAAAEEKLTALEAERKQQQGVLDRTVRELESEKASKAALETALVQELADLRICPAVTERDVRRALGSLKSEVASANDLSRQNEDLSKRLKESNQEADSLRQQNREIARRGEEAGGEVEKLNIEIRPLRQQKKEFSRLLEDASDDNKRLRKRVANLEAETGPLEQQNNQLKKRVANLESEINQPRMRQRGFMDEKKDDSMNLVRQLEDRGHELAALQGRYEDLTRSHQGFAKASRDAAVALSNQLEDRNQALDDLQKKFRKANSELLAAKEGLRKLEDENAEKEDNLTHLRKRVDDAKNEAKKLKPKMQKVSLELEEACAARDAAQKAEQAKGAHMEGLRKRQLKENDAKNERIEQLSKDLLAAEKATTETKQELEETKSKVRKMTEDKREHNKDATKQRDRIAALEAQVTEITANKDAVDAKLKKTVAGMDGLMGTLATVENDFNVREAESQGAYQNLLSRAQGLENRLPAMVEEKERLESEVDHVRGKLRESLSRNADLQASCDQADANIRSVVRGLAKTVEPDPMRRVREQGTQDPIDVVAKVKAAFEEKKEELMKASRANKELQGLLSSKLKDAEGQGERLQSKLRDAEGQKAGLVSKLRDAEGQGEKLNDNVAALKQAKEELLGDKAILRNKLNEAMAAVSKLKDKVTEQRRVNDDIVALRAENEELHAKFDRLKNVRPEERTRALELTLGDRDKRLKQVLGQLQERDEEKEVLREEAVTLKWFLEEFLDEGKQLVDVLREAMDESENDQLNDSRDSSTRGVLERLESMMKNIETKVDDIPVSQNGLVEREEVGNDSGASTPPAKPDDLFGRSEELSEIRPLPSPARFPLPGAAKSPSTFRLNLPPPASRPVAPPRYRPTRSRAEARPSSLKAALAHDRAAYVEKRLADSTFGANPKSSPKTSPLRDRADYVDKRLAVAEANSSPSRHRIPSTPHRSSRWRDPFTRANPNTSWKKARPHATRESDDMSKSYTDPPTKSSVDVTGTVDLSTGSARSRLNRARMASALA